MVEISHRLRKVSFAEDVRLHNRFGFFQRCGQFVNRHVGQSFAYRKVGVCMNLEYLGFGAFAERRFADGKNNFVNLGQVGFSHNRNPCYFVKIMYIYTPDFYKRQHVMNIFLSIKRKKLPPGNGSF